MTADPVASLVRLSRLKHPRKAISAGMHRRGRRVERCGDHGCCRFSETDRTDLVILIAGNLYISYIILRIINIHFADVKQCEFMLGSRPASNLTWSMSWRSQCEMASPCRGATLFNRMWNDVKPVNMSEHVQFRSTYQALKTSISMRSCFVKGKPHLNWKNMSNEKKT